MWGCNFLNDDVMNKITSHCIYFPALSSDGDSAGMEIVGNLPSKF